MYFFRQKGKQALDLKGDLILSHNKDLIITRGRSIAPRVVQNSRFITGIPGFSIWRKLRTTGAAIAFIWGPSQALQPAEIENPEK